MARLGRLLERFGPEGVVVMSAAEYERVQLKAYTSGWQDAAEEYTPRIAAAHWEGWLGRWRPLRVMEGSGDVIDFPAHRPPERDTAAGNDPADPADPAGPAGSSGTTGPSGPAGGGSRGGTRGGAAEGVPGRAEPERWAGGRGGTPVPRTFLSPKNRRSKSPTIPRLPAPDRRRPRTGSDVPDDAPD